MSQLELKASSDGMMDEKERLRLTELFLVRLKAYKPVKAAFMPAPRRARKRKQPVITMTDAELLEANRLHDLRHANSFRLVELLPRTSK